MVSPRGIGYDGGGISTTLHLGTEIRGMSLNHQSSVKVVPLDASTNVSESMVGAKALSLDRMKRIGLAVPPGFCIAATAFRGHVEANELAGKIESALDKLNSAPIEDNKSILLELQQAIMNAPLADGLRHEIENGYRALTASRVAIRSSATAEDLPNHSFAGQYET